MPIKYNTCPFCNKKIAFKITKEDIDTSYYPAPVYIFHEDKSCNKTATFYLDSLLRVSYIEPEKKKSLTGKEIKTITTIT